MDVKEFGPVVLSALQLEVQIASTTLLEHQDLLLREGEKIGLVGRNGCGKSTLLKILAGKEHFYRGEVNIRKNLRMAFLAQEVDLLEQQTVRENILAGAADTLQLLHDYEHGAAGHQLHSIEQEITARDGWGLETRLNELADALSVPALSRLGGELSGGEKRRVALCRALIDFPELLLLDEPTNHLDTQTIEWLETYLQRFNGTCLFVTHDRYFLDCTCTSILELSYGKFFRYQGNYSDFLQQKADRISEAESHEEKRLAFIRREIDWIRRGPKARGTKSWSRIQRFDAAVNTEALKQEENVDLLIPEAEKLGNIVAVVKDVSLERNGQLLFKELNLEFAPGMRLGVVGRNGLGKTSFLKLLLGELTPSSGTVRLGERTTMNYADQHRVTLNDEKTVLEDLGEGNDFIWFGNRKISIWTYLKRFLFQDDEINTKVGRLSGGERNRLVLAKVLKRGGNFLLLDEPTNDLDLATLRILEEALVDFAGCVVVVSHDRYFLNRVCTHMLSFEGGGDVIYQPGNYNYFVQKRNEWSRQSLASSEDRQSSEKKAPDDKPRERKKTKLNWAEQREFEGMEEAIRNAEGKIAEIEALFILPDFHARHGRQLPELQADLDNAKAEVERLYGRWAELEEQNEG
ncbi:MAG: ATP-binding cassette domain-containing protein [Lentisphaeria bacterium]